MRATRRHFIHVVMRSWFYGSLVFIGAFGCSGPSITRFEITPQVLCQGEKAIVSWDANGKTDLAIQEEPAEVVEECQAIGHHTFAVTLAARVGSEEVERRLELEQLEENSAEPIAMHTNALDGSDVVASGDKNAALWDRWVTVASVRACESRSITIKHAGKTATVAPGRIPSDELAGTPVSGPWELRSTLTAEELKTPSLRPKELTVLATLRCGK
jgi:hypothetical protein